jgi:myosin heavy subunit
VLAAVLHLGNLQPIEDDNLDYCEIVPSSTLDTVCKLLEVDKKYLFESLTSYCIKIGGEDLIKSFSKREVQELIHSLSKALYEGLFQWIINEINKSTRSEQRNSLSYLTLGFLDIYGFEVLKDNSLEQLFINYTN